MLQMIFIADLIACPTCFGAPLYPSSGAREYYAEGCCLWYLVLWFSSCRYGVELRVMCPDTHEEYYETPCVFHTTPDFIFVFVNVVFGKPFYKL